MNAAVTDACIFIDLRNLNLIHHFFELDYMFHSSVDVINELYEEDKLVLQPYVDSGRLTIHSIDEFERLCIQKTQFPAALSEADKTVLFLAQKLNAIVVSSDKVVRKYASKNGVTYHGMLWILDQLLDVQVISGLEASQKLEMLIRNNIVYQNNAELVSEMQKRLKMWKK
ncbi:hypothetical protein MUK70_06205 [Dyadobacter chenwenxiniae]|uniref:PIN domain-containing protein n=1 Tax=Dyadobacter chenwenxiniae TaxID=2906456 RepID=A0A9X1PRH2_9BACT|nr:hypothetical protein [Dyadobacter chenwenxiniae]MCF0065150.1 hypothetical protein [Dyadobacter chenwenxiniae]UON84578.1 hypothetical protein MUK70_06205 [Dyadobacter chenwenxiniae]